MHNYVEMVAAYFDKNPIDLAKEYQWPRREPVPFDQTFEKRKELSKTFNSETQMRKLLATQMVKTWGGIRRGSVSAIDEMAAEVPEQLIKRGLIRVASWSKVIALHDPEKFLIYDARVAFAINIILYKSGSIETYFPMPLSQNSHLKKAAKSLVGFRLKSGASKIINGLDFYSAYLLLARTVAQKIGRPPWQIEMALFARGPELAKEVT